MVRMDETVEMLCRDCDAVALFVQPVTEDPVDDLMCVICGWNYESVKILPF